MLASQSHVPRVSQKSEKIDAGRPLEKMRTSQMPIIHETEIDEELEERNSFGDASEVRASNRQLKVPSITKPNSMSIKNSNRQTGKFKEESKVFEDDRNPEYFSFGENIPVPSRAISVNEKRASIDDWKVEIESQDQLVQSVAPDAYKLFAREVADDLQ